MQTQRTNIGMVEGCFKQQAEALDVAIQQRVGGGALKILNGHQSPLQQLLFGLAHLLPAEITAQCQGHQAGGYEGHQQDPGIEAQVAARTWWGVGGSWLVQCISLSLLPVSYFKKHGRTAHPVSALSRRKKHD